MIACRHAAGEFFLSAKGTTFLRGKGELRHGHAASSFLVERLMTFGMFLHKDE